MTIGACALPARALTQKFARDGHYVDCFTTDVGAAISHAQYVEAFYTTWVFRLERWILRWAISRPSSDDEARELARGTLERFSAWGVEARADDQLLMRDEFTKRTLSWLMTERLPEDSTRLYFGSVVVKARDGRMGSKFSATLGFHTLYSRVLLGAAAKRVAAMGRSCGSAVP